MRTFKLTLILLFVLPFSVFSQDRIRSHSATDSVRTTVGADHEIAAWMIGEYGKNVAIAKYGRQYATSDLTRDFANQLIKDSESAVWKFSKWASQADPTARDLVVADASAEPNSTQWLRIHRDLQARAVVAFTSSLAGKSGSNFDREFLRVQIDILQRKKTIDRVLAEVASPGCRERLEECLELDAAHLKQATRILEKLQGDDAALQTARR
jgi:hypothetical protein